MRLGENVIETAYEQTRTSNRYQYIKTQLFQNIKTQACLRGSVLLSTPHHLCYLKVHQNPAQKTQLKVTENTIKYHITEGQNLILFNFTLHSRFRDKTWLSRPCVPGVNTRSTVSPVILERSIKQLLLLLSFVILERKTKLLLFFHHLVLARCLSLLLL